MADVNDKQIDDIVAMLDAFMDNKGGHMNIRVAEDGTVNADTTMAKTVTTMKSMDCAAGDLACNVPTLFEGMDRDPGDEYYATVEDPENSETEMDDTY